jgi:hypothetical protein
MPTKNKLRANDAPGESGNDGIVRAQFSSGNENGICISNIAQSLRLASGSCQRNLKIVYQNTTFKRTELNGKPVERDLQWVKPQPISLVVGSFRQASQEGEMRNGP